MEEVIKIVYPSVSSFSFHSDELESWPAEKFGQINSIFKATGSRTIISQEIINFQILVTGKPDLPFGFTRSLEIIKNILYYLHKYNIIYNKNNNGLVELCFGTGIITIPMIEYVNVVAIEKNLNYLSQLRQYILSNEFKNKIQLHYGDISNTIQILDILKKSKVNYEVIVINPPWNLICDSLDLLIELEPKFAILILPLDILLEANAMNSNRRLELETIEKNRTKHIILQRIMALVEIIPTLRIDGSSQTGTFFYRRIENK